MNLHLSLLLLVTITAQCAVYGAAERRYTYNIPSGQPLEKTPGYLGSLIPMKQVPEITITQAPVTWKLSDPGGLQLEFTAPSYLTGTSKLPYAFGPTLRLRAGGIMKIKLVNEMIMEGNITEEAPHAFMGPLDTNLHTHGLWDPNGVYDQNQTSYAGQDNIFINVPARKKPSDAPASLDFSSNIFREHLPGIHWYHPHKHGSTTIQTSTSHGSIIIEDDPFWLPARRGLCGPMQALIATAPEVLLDISLLFFKLASNPAKVWDSPTYQLVSNYSSPQNPLCCDSKNGWVFGGSMTKGNGTDILLVSGAYKPVITMADGVWYRWRMLYSGAKGWSTFRFLDTAMANSKQCEWLLIAKDGVYLMNIPRKVEAVLMSSGNRLEAMVRCSLPSRSSSNEFILSATATNDPFNPGNNQTFATDFFRVAQDEVARIKVVRRPGSKGQHINKAAKYAAEQATKDTQAAPAAAAAGADAEVDVAAVDPAHFYSKPPKWDSRFYRNPVPDSCTPLRPSYAVDMRDAALTAAGYPPSRVNNTDVNFAGYNNADGLGTTCTVNGQLFSFPDPSPLVLPMGEIVQWTTNNGRSHPFHVHTQPFQLTGFNLSNQLIGTELTNFFQVGDFTDTMLIPQISIGAGSVQMRFQPGPFSGYAVMHCHYLNHEDLGCMKVIQWKCPGYDAVQPASGICTNFKYPVPGAVPSY